MLFFVFKIVTYSIPYIAIQEHLLILSVLHESVKEYNKQVVSPVSSTNKTDHHDITDILLKVALNTITLYNKLKSSDTKVLIKAYIEEEQSIDWQKKNTKKIAENQWTTK